MLSADFSCTGSKVKKRGLLAADPRNSMKVINSGWPQLKAQFLPGLRPVTGVGAGAVGRIPAYGGDDVLDAVVVRRRVHRRGAVAGAVAGGAGAAEMI